MTGHDAILKLRRAGFAPACIWVDDQLHPYANDGTTVCLAPTDVPEMQDWRFCKGIPVLVSAESKDRLHRIAASVGEHASRVIANLVEIDNTQRDWLGRPKVAVTAITDTKGKFTWQK